ncbi:hypothetical protein SUGI_1073290 [Cryptomeria japonica]|uniref:uncharacterized protein LOC131027748 n=1 Tax=Cryptomeria japonica TaxID=3369 RepID=UPI0024146970|nr:uncharacterized protein LOC131027748 [Cryptomeria japonica]GLJ50370.1 hypothetical protein SUGI_1073290 [Cryptomeria japonica]
MRNYLWRARHKPVHKISVIHSDGSVGALEEHGITASELMQRYPQRIVSHANSFYIGKKVPVLSSGEKLEGGQSYFLLPERMQGSILSAAWLASLAGGGSKAVSPLHGRCCVMSVETFEIEKREDGRLQLKILPQFIQKLLENGKMNAQSSKDDCFSHSGLCSTPQLQKDYQQMVKVRGQAWKPRLETIVEKRNGFKLFGLKRKRRV